VLKGRLDAEGSQLVTDCYQLKMEVYDGKMRQTDIKTPHFAANIHKLHVFKSKNT